MLWRNWTCVLVFGLLGLVFMFVGLGGGCTIRIGPLDEAAGGVAVLPDPGGGSGDEPSLDAAQQARKEEVDRYILDVVYQRATVVYAVELPSGDIVDFMDRSTLPALPDELPALPFAPEDFVLPPGVGFGLTELEQIPAYLELAATTTPFVRPSFWPYILGDDAPDATSVEDFLARYQAGGAPSGVDRLYAGLASKEPNRGVSGYMSQFRPEVADKSFSLIEFTVFCSAEGPVQEQIGIVISVDKKNTFGTNRKRYQDGEARMHIEYARTVNGQVEYIWDGMDGHFVANPFRLHQPGEKVPVSILDKTSVEHLVAIFQVPTGDWWIAFDGDLLGYYPASLFSTLNGGGCGSAWYGEVYNDKPGVPVNTEMGSGQFADTGLFNAAHIRNPKFYDLLWFGLEPKDEFSMIPNEPLCYTKSPLTHIGPPWDSSFVFIGGPGSNSPECIWP